MKIEVTLLDGTLVKFELDSKSIGQDLLDKVAEHLNLVEKEYFGFLHVNESDHVLTWLRNDRRIGNQLKKEPKCIFQVKFYPPEPVQLQEVLTRYQICLQIQNDIKNGKLPCSFVTHAVLGAYLVQSELGDYDYDEHGSSVDYLRDFDFTPSQSDDLLHKIMEIHRTNLKGQSPAEAELHYLETAKKLALYGVSLHHAKDSENVNIVVGVCSSGILVYRDKLRINRFAWPKITKISYKRNGFFIKLRPGEFDEFESSVGFQLNNHHAAKRLWKICVEHHSFFRLQSLEPRVRFSFPKFGSTFRYSGRTQHQAQISSKIHCEDNLSPTPPGGLHDLYHQRNAHYHPKNRKDLDDIKTLENSDDVLVETSLPLQSNCMNVIVAMPVVEQTQGYKRQARNFYEDEKSHLGSKQFPKPGFRQTSSASANTSLLESVWNPLPINEEFHENNEAIADEKAKNEIIQNRSERMRLDLGLSATK